MIPLSGPAQRQLDALTAHYERLGRAAAIRNLLAAVEAVSARIEAAGGTGLPAPTPYPDIARLGLGFRWLKQGPYWFAFTNTPGRLTITGSFYETSDIPNRL